MIAKRIRVAMLAAGVACCGAGFTIPAMAQSAMNDQDKSFLKDAVPGNQMEIEAGKLAAEKAKNPEVKAFGQKMVTDHTKLGNDVKPFADAAGAKPDLSMAAHAKMTELHALQGDTFDKNYVETMVKDHHDDLAAFMKERDATQDPALKKTLTAGIAVIRRHAMMIDAIAKKMGIQTPAMPAGN